MYRGGQSEPVVAEHAISDLTIECMENRLYSNIVELLPAFKRSPSQSRCCRFLHSVCSGAYRCT